MSSKNPSDQQKYSQSSQNQGKQGDQIAFVRRGRGLNFQPQSNLQGQAMHLRNPQTNEEMIIQLANASQQSQQTQGSQSGQQSGSNAEVWQVINSSKNG